MEGEVQLLAKLQMTINFLDLFATDIITYPNPRTVLFKIMLRSKQSRFDGDDLVLCVALCFVPGTSTLQNKFFYDLI